MATKSELAPLIKPAVPRLRALAVGLCGDVDLADDLVQDTILRAWEKHDRFTIETNIDAWLYTILRNIYFDLIRKRRREIEDIDEVHANALHSSATQESHVDLEILSSHMSKLIPEQREAVLLVGATGMTYQEAADVIGCSAGTVKSRVSRARSKLERSFKKQSGAKEVTRVSKKKVA